jgi:hypothetical protein
LAGEHSPQDVRPIRWVHSHALIHLTVVCSCKVCVLISCLHFRESDPLLSSGTVTLFRYFRNIRMDGNFGRLNYCSLIFLVLHIA